MAEKAKNHAFLGKLSVNFNKEEGAPALSRRPLLQFYMDMVAFAGKLV